MKVVCEFQCSSVAKHVGGIEFVVFTASMRSKDGNAAWSKFTPSGRLEMTITADGAQGVFVPGKFYALTIEEVD